MSADGADGDGGAKQRFELYIKASAIDKETKGSCPICQHWFMITCLLGENQDDIDFKVYTVQADCPPKNFGVDQGWSKKFPVIMVLGGRDKKGQDLTGTRYDTFEELEIFFESINRECPELKRKNAPNVAAMHAVEDVYNAFNTFLSGKGPKRLSSELKKINEFLESDDCTFLVDNVLSFADCYLLPRLQHIRVAGKAYMEYDIPAEYTNVWRYLTEAYKLEAFRSTMPSDQDIVFHYEKKVMNSMQRVKRHPRPTLQNFSYTFDIPEDIALALSQAATADAGNGHAAAPSPPTQQLAEVDIAPPPPEPEVVAQEEERVAEEPAPVVAESEDVAVDEGVVNNAAIDDDVSPSVADAEQAVVADDAVTANDGAGSETVSDENMGAGDGGDAAVDADVGGSEGASENEAASVSDVVQSENDTVVREEEGGVPHEDGDADAKTEGDGDVTKSEVMNAEEVVVTPNGIAQ